MANQYNGKITRNTDWGGDASTGFLPVGGGSVQNFIKEDLNTKIGAVYKPDGINTVYYFSNDEDKQAFIETDDMSYVLYSYELESNYEVQIDRDNLVISHSVIEGTTGNSVAFRFKIVDENGMTADAKAKIELSFTGSGISNRFTNEIAVVAGDWTSFSVNVDEYLRKGSNSVAVKIVGMSTKATTQFVMTYNIFDLTFEVNFEYNKAKTGNTMMVPYIIECSDPKYLEFYIDGNPVSSTESMVINDIRYDSVATLNIANLALGQHSLQVRAYVRANDGTQFFTPMHFFTFAKEGDAETSFLMYSVKENGSEIFEPGENYKIALSQFEQIKFDWSIYDFTERKLTIIFEYDGAVVSSNVVYGNEDIRTFNYRPMNYGDGKELKVYALGENDEKIFEYVLDIDVAETTSGIKEATDGLLLKLTAMGRRNTDANKDVWSCIGSDGNEYRATFNNFTWNAQQGWDEETESLVIANGATVDFNLSPMSWDWVAQGGAVEIDLETFDIENENAIICECANNAQEREAFFRITATKAEFSTAMGTAINTRFKDNERLKIMFIGNRGDLTGRYEDGNLIYIVVNGVLERAGLYVYNANEHDSLWSEAPLSIGDPTGQCKVRLRSIRVYNRAVTVDQAFNNYVVDSDDVQGLYEKNNVLKAGSATEIGFDEVANKLPVMIFTGDMDELVTEGQTSKKEGKWYDFDVEYINRQEPERNFVSFNCKMKLQGTSSLGYPRKNFKLKTKDTGFTADAYEVSRYELDPTSVVGNLMLRDKRTGQRIDFDDFKTNGTLRNTNTFTLDFEGKPLNKGKYRFRKGAHKAQKWTLKADFMESSCSHNVGAGRSWNDIFENTELLNNGEGSYINQTYQDSALYRGENKDFVEYNGYNIKGKVAHYKIPYNPEAIKDQKKYVCRTDAQKICIASEQDDIRTAVDGFPMVCFYRRNHSENQLIFIGQYNFINDKGSYEVFGFEDIEDPEDEETMIYDSNKVEVWEGLKNTNPLSLFKTIDGFYDEVPGQNLKKWQETYEARYPDPEDYESDPTALYELSKWIVSTRHEADTVYNGTLDIDSSFAERINTAQYGFTTATIDSYRYANGTGLEDNAENRQKKFETEKWEHFDVWKLAGYYIYLRRYGAVDQFVKNTMLFTDGNGRYDPRSGDPRYRKWFFINYDNDCLFGLRNNGQLAFHWDLDRQTIDAASDILVDDQADDEGGDTNAYAMMGHDSTLWNNLERDDEFMRMVRDLDYSMSQYKLNYNNMVEEFDTKQTEQWCERIYNANERYKYIQAAKGIGDMEGRAVNNLWMLQGTRRSHRHWWIANHFNLLDAQWLSGDYKNTYVEIKTNCKSGDTISAIAGTKYYYAWGQQKKIYQSNMQRNEGETIDFVFDTEQSQGDPVYIYSFNKMSEMDFSGIARYAYEGSFKFVLGNDLVQNTLKKLVIGHPNVKNTKAQDTTTWEKIPNLEYLDIQNYEGITSVPLSAFKNLHTFKAFGSKLGGFGPAEGSTFDLVELPSTINTMKLADISFKNSVYSDLSYTANTNLNTLEISNNYGVGLDYYNKIIAPWIASIEASTQWASLYRGKSITIKNIDWSFNDLDSLRIFKNFSKLGKTFDLSGVIDLRWCGNLSMENIEEIKDIFGENCFNKMMSKLYIITPDSVFIDSEKTEMVAGQTNVFERVIYPDENAIESFSITYYLVNETTKAKKDALEGETIFEDPIGKKNYIVIENAASVRYGLSLTNTVDGNGKQIGVLSCGEYALGTDTTVKVLVYMYIPSSSYDKVSVMNFAIKDPTYASVSSISGSKSLYKNNEYRYKLTALTSAGIAPIGSYDVAWNLSGDAVASYVSSYQADPNDPMTFIVHTNASQPDSSEISSQMTVSARITNHDAGSSVVDASYSVLVLNENVIMTRDSNPVVMQICKEAGWASNANAMTKAEAEAVTSIEKKFKGKNTSSFSFPEFKYFTGVTALAASAFQGSRLTEIVLPNTISEIGAYAFNECTALTNVVIERENLETGEIEEVKTLPNGITAINEGVFRNCSSLNELDLPDSVTDIANFAFGGTAFVEARLHESEGGEGTLRLPSNLLTIAGSAFESERWAPYTTTNRLKVFEIPLSLTSAALGAEVLLGRNYEEFHVSDEHTNFYLVDGVLYDKNMQVIFRYPPKKAYQELCDTYSTIVIRDYAFFAVKNLDNLIMNGTVSSFGYGICMDSNIKMIDMSSCRNISEIKYDSFRGCSQLKTILMPVDGTLKKLGMAAFSGCSLLENINLPEGLEEFENDSLGYSYAFAGCDSLSGFTFPSTVKKVGIHTVYDCDNLEYVIFPDFYDFTTPWRVGGQTTDMEAHSDNIPFNIVAACGSLESVTLPVFSYDSEDEGGNIISVDLNDDILSGNKWVKKFSEPTGITQSYDFFFVRSDSVSGIREIKISSRDNGNRFVSISGVIYTADKTKLVKAPWAIDTLELPVETVQIGSNAFYNSRISTINFTTPVREVGTSSFQGAYNFSTAAILKDLENVGTNAFEGCNFKDVIIGSNFTGIPQYFMNGMGSLESLTFAGYHGSGIGRFAFQNTNNLKTIIVSADEAPTLSNILGSGGETMGWYQFQNAGRNVPQSERVVLVSVGTLSSYFKEAGETASDSTYVPSQETSWKFLNTVYGYTFKEEIPLSGVCDVVVYDTNGQPYTGIVYATSSLGHLVGDGGAVYSSTYDPIDESYMFILDDLYDNETVYVYADAAMTTLLGTFKPRITSRNYQVGTPSLGAGLRSMKLGAPANDEGEEMAEITKAEYEALMSKVSQMAKIIKKLVK